MSANPEVLTEKEANARSRIGRVVVYFALVATTLLGITAISVALVSAPEKDQTAYVKDVLTMILPMIGTWVGTVLAFYFTRENYVAAAQQNVELMRELKLTPEQQLQSITVTEAMLDMSAPTTEKLTLATPADAARLKLKADVAEGILEKHKRNRLPIVDTDGKMMYIIHKNYIDEFLVRYANSGKPLADATLQELLDTQDLAAIFLSFAVVGKAARLIAVKQLMDGNANCADVFVTEDGTKGSKAVGWITNVIVQEKAVVA